MYVALLPQIQLYDVCRLQTASTHVGLNSTLVGLNASPFILNNAQVSLCTVSYQQRKWECIDYNIHAASS